MKFATTREAGFTLIELMVVVGIIGFLAAMAIPRFRNFRASAQQTEGKVGLNALYLHKSIFFQSMQRYHGVVAANTVIAGAAGGTNAGASASAQEATGGGLIGFSLEKPLAIYDIYFHSAAVASRPTGFAAGATSARILVNGSYDYQRINARNILCHAFNAVTKFSDASCNVAAQMQTVASATTTGGTGPRYVSVAPLTDDPQ